MLFIFLQTTKKEEKSQYLLQPMVINSCEEQQTGRGGKRSIIILRTELGEGVFSKLMSK